MDAVINYLKEYWVLVLLLVVAFIAMLFMFRKASISATKAKERKEELIKKLDRLKFLKENYSELTEEKIKNDNSEDLFDGVVSNIQYKLEAQSDMNQAFEKLNEESKMIYGFSYFLEEAENKPSEFFRQYTKPITPYVAAACKAFADKELFALIKEEYDSFDEENETASVIEEKINKLDDEIKEKLDVVQMKKRAMEFIKENAEKFI